MYLSTAIIDDFMPNAKAIRAFALQQDFKPVEFDGHTYKGIGIENQPEGIEARISTALGSKIKTAMSFYRLAKEDDDTTSFIHADTTCGGTHAGILYLSDPTAPMQGTAFWKNRGLGLDRIPAGSVEDRVNWVNTNKDLVNGEANDESKWDMLGLIGMKFNRLSVYPTDFFHSRFPRQSFGDSKDSARLVWVTFFDM